MMIDCLLLKAWLLTGKYHDKEIAFLLTNAFEAVGRKREFTDDQIKKHRHRYVVPRIKDAKKPLFDRAHFDEPPVIYDYVTGLPVSEATTDKPTPPEPLTTCPGEAEPGDSEIVVEIPPPAGQEHSVASSRSAATVGLQQPLPAAGESIGDPPTRPNNHPRVITVELG
jgi:hypothetical protein